MQRLMIMMSFASDTVKARHSPVDFQLATSIKGHVSDTEYLRCLSIRRRKQTTTTTTMDSPASMEQDLDAEISSIRAESKLPIFPSIMV